MVHHNIDSHTQRYDIWRYIKKFYDTITIRYRSISIDISILYTYFKQPSTFLLTHKCNQNI